MLGYLKPHHITHPHHTNALWFGILCSEVKHFWFVRNSQSLHLLYTGGLQVMANHGIAYLIPQICLEFQKPSKITVSQNLL